MAPIPTLYTPRLVLRPFTRADAPRVQELAGDHRVADMTVRIPHPYPDGAAEKWIDSLAPAAVAGKGYAFAITLAGTRTPGREFDWLDTGHLIGSIGLEAHSETAPDQAELGYWIGVPYWNKGFGTEAARAVLEFGFARDRFQRIVAHHFVENAASGRLLTKLGMVREGVRQGVPARGGVPVDVVLYGLDRAGWAKLRRKPRLPMRHGGQLQPA